MLEVRLPRSPKCLLHDFRNRLLVDSALLAVTRLHPIRQLFCSFACIAREATSDNIVTSDDTCIVDDVFPRCEGFSGATPRHLLDHFDTTIDASFISLLHFLFKPVRDAPTVHGPS